MLKITKINSKCLCCPKVFSLNHIAIKSERQKPRFNSWHHLHFCTAAEWIKDDVHESAKALTATSLASYLTSLNLSFLLCTTKMTKISIFYSYYNNQDNINYDTILSKYSINIKDQLSSVDDFFILS